MSISRILNEVRPLIQLLEEPLVRPSAFYVRPQRMSFEDPFRSPFGGLGALGGRPAVDVYEDGDKYIVAADLPGVKKEDVEVRVGEDGRSITIEGRRVQKAEEQRASEAAQQGETDSTAVSPGETTGSLARERFYSVNSQFERTVWLPRAVDSESVRARLQDGVLRVTASRAEDRASTVVAVE
ncbi:hypothetical protein AX14_003253 [Amanita brunnescens Koide BX004]|nr:hypothetical protein AX14_003253 [Amanita brunnescens Koide BX004]